MKALFTLLALCICHLAFPQAEVIEKSYPFTGQKLDLDMDLGNSLTIKASPDNQIKIKITYEINNGSGNDALGWDIDDYGDRLAVDIDLDQKKIKRSDDCCCDNNKGGTYWNSDRGRVCADIQVEILIPATANLDIKTIVADVEISGITGNIEAETVTGIIDLTWEEAHGASITMKTTTGEVFTNLELERKVEKGLPLISSHDIQAVYKNHDREVSLKTVTSNIYFRKRS